LKDNDRNAMLHNDLAVALMEREKAKGRTAGGDFADALEHLRRAIELDGSLLEALFNLALCHQYQGLWRTAKEDWKRYLEKDSQSPWAEEARKNLEKVSEKFEQGGQDREDIHRDFLDAYRRGDGEQARRTYKRGWLPTGNFITKSPRKA